MLDIINERSDDIYKILAESGKTMRFLATGTDKESESDTPSLVKVSGVDFDQGRYTDNHLETRLGPDGLQKRLLKIARDAKTVEEEQGVNILYLAMGFLTWYEDDTSSIKREAPLVLVPVGLIRNKQTATYDVKVRDEDIVTNLPLQERLKGDFGIHIPDINIDEGWIPSHYFDAVTGTVASRPRWEIDRDGMQLGFFSFSKLLMFRDLDPENWPANALENHQLTRGILYEGFEPEEPMFGKEDKLDEKFPPASLFHVVDADASQAKVIEEVRSGRNLVVQGPPGTGKSQTITNIIAAAVRDGKRVLFVAEKMAALSVVHKRLVDVGLEDICLELHSKTANKKAVHNELARTLNAARAVPNMPAAPDRLHHTRDQLNRITTKLHKLVGQSGDSAFSAISQQMRFIGCGTPTPKLNLDGLGHIPKDEAHALAAIIVEYGAALAVTGPLTKHPFFGAEYFGLQPNDLARLKSKIDVISKLALALANGIQTTSDAIGLNIDACLYSASVLVDQLQRLADPPKADDKLLAKFFVLNAKDRLRDILRAGTEWRAIRDENNAVFSDAAWSADAVSLRPPLAAGKFSFFARWGSAYRQASRQLANFLTNAMPKTAADRTDLVDRLIKIASLREAWKSDDTWCASVIGDEWRGERTTFSKLLDSLNWCDHASGEEIYPEPSHAITLARNPEQISELIANLETSTLAQGLRDIIGTLQFDIASTFGESVIEVCDLRIVAHKLAAMATATDRYDEWVKLKKLRGHLLSANLQGLLSHMESGEMGPGGAADEFLFARAEAIWKLALEVSPTLSSLRNEDRHKLVSDFQRLEKERRSDCVKSIRAHHLGQIPQGAKGEMAVIRSEIAKKRAHMPLRKLFSNAAEAIQRIKPVVLMSPISVAQFLPPESIGFDLLLIDEASQVRPEDALGAIARAKQIVVVGDHKQLPPSSFFDRMASNAPDNDDDEADENLLSGAAPVGELESILTLCEARGLGSRMLEWHYRSRDPSLIRVSNHEFYRDKLILPPSPLQNDPAYGLVFSHIAGIYDRGGKRDNRLEGEAVINRVIEHAENMPTMSLGIVTFSSAQRNLITELLEYHRRTNPTLDSFLREGCSEDVFVKNIENVQGDERDVILISIGYGPTEPGGRLKMNFGPVNNEGGERRLNVLFTRARVRCEGFCSFDPGDMDLTKTSKEGPKILKRFLEFAKTGAIDDKAPTGDGPDSPFEADVAEAITKMGYNVDHQVGSAGFRIDLGIRHPNRPGTYIIAVECDGATYHSAIWARERDRLRQNVLEHLGWRFHRIWSTDWFYRRATELDRLRAALSDAKAASDHDIVIRGANEE